MSRTASTVSPIRGEVLGLVVDDALGAQPPHQLDVRGGRGRDDVHAEVGEQLHRRRPDRAGRAVHEDPLRPARCRRGGCRDSA